MTRLLIVLLSALAIGCASTTQGPAAKTKPGSGGVAMHEDDDFDWAWSVPGLDWRAYDVLYLIEPRADVKDLKPDDAESLGAFSDLNRPGFPGGSIP